MSPTTALDALARSLGVDVGVIPLYIARALVTAVIIHFIFARTSSRGGASTSTASTKKTKIDPRTPYTRDEIARHASVDDLWVIIDDKVYDLTDYVDEHPGGVDAIAKNGGGDATEGFKGPQHPSRVFDIVEEYRVGVLARE
jgi:cytochrome b involved in lipid metabolism|tara:strand:- start:174 stop:599 length:426 start_codon:yes stop_codon:yes gene_type:complete